jgi:hypothetical protein
MARMAVGPARARTRGRSTLAFQVSERTFFGNHTLLGMSGYYDRQIVSVSAVLFLQTFSGSSRLSRRESALEIALAAVLLFDQDIRARGGADDLACRLPVAAPCRPPVSEPVRYAAFIRRDHRNRVRSNTA